MKLTYFSYLKICFFLFLILLHAGCTRLSVNLLGEPLLSDMVENISRTKNVRLVKEGLAGQVLLATAITEMSPHNVDLLTETSFLYCAYGLFMEDEDPEYAKSLYELGRDYGTRALKQNHRFKNGLDARKKISELTDFLDEEYAGALCWAGVNGGLSIMLSLDNPGTLIEMADIIAMIKRSLSLDENYFHGVGKIFLGAYYALVPSYMGLGGGVANSRKMFQKAREVTEGRFLFADLFEARFLATIVGDETLFEENLKRVISADPSEPKEARLMNELAKVKARYYLSHKADYF